MVVERSLFGPNVLLGMNTLTRWLTNSGCVAQALIEPLVHGALNDYECNVSTAKDQPQYRPLLPRWIRTQNFRKSGQRRTMSRVDPLDPHEVKNACEKEIKNLWYMEVYEHFTEAVARARTGCNPVGLKWIDTNKGSAEAPRYRSRLV